MATTTFTDLNIADTYLGILHSKGEALPASGQQYIYDAAGNVSDMKLGRNGAGVSFNGALSAASGQFVSLSTTSFNSISIVSTTLTVNGLKYPTGPGSLSSFMVQGANNQMVMTTKIPQGSIPALIPSPAGSYSLIDTIVVNSAGQVTSVTEIPATGAYTISSTTYFQFASNPTHIITPGSSYGGSTSWSNIPSTAKTAILFIGPYNNQGMANETAVYELAASPDGTQSHEWPIMTSTGAQVGGDTATPYLGGVQCVVRLEQNGANMRTYIRRKSGSPSQTLEVYLIGYQQ
jgi:hypothetical protein